MLQLRETCRRLRVLAHAEQLWERLCWVHFRRVRSSIVAGSYQQVYHEHQRFCNARHATRPAGGLPCAVCGRPHMRRCGVGEAVAFAEELGKWMLSERMANLL